MPATDGRTLRSLLARLPPQVTELARTLGLLDLECPAALPDGGLADADGVDETWATGEDANRYPDASDRLTGVSYGQGTTVLYKLGLDGTRLGEKTLPNGTPAFTEYGTPGAADELTYQYDLRGTGNLQELDEVVQLADGGTLNTTRATYDVDAAGRTKRITTSSGTTTYTWDVADRLIQAEVGGQTTSYTYDHQGWRRQKVGPSGTVNYVWGADGVAEENGAVYERSAGLVLAANGRTLLHDAQSVIGAVNAAGPPTLYRYDAWGNFRTDPYHVSPSALGPSVAYAGQTWDADIGRSYAQQRWYEPGIGRFESEDPLMPFGRLSMPMGIQPFGYANGNSLAFVDPNGEGQSDLFEGCIKGFGNDLGFSLFGLVDEKNADLMIGVRGCRPISALKSLGRSTNEILYTSDVGTTTRQYWLATEGRQKVVGAVLGGGVGLANAVGLPADLPNQLPPAALSTAKPARFSVAAATAVVSVVDLAGTNFNQWRGPEHQTSSPELTTVNGAEPRVPYSAAEPPVPADAIDQNTFMASNGGGPQSASAGTVEGPNAARGPIWSPTKGKTSVENAFGHWKKHGAEFPEFQNAKQYTEGARRFLNEPPQGALTNVRPNGEVVVYEPSTNTFGVRAADGTPKTMFRPDPAKHPYPTNLDYFHAQ